MRVLRGWHNWQQFVTDETREEIEFGHALHEMTHLYADSAGKLIFVEDDEYKGSSRELLNEPENFTLYRHDESVELKTFLDLIQEKWGHDPVHICTTEITEDVDGYEIELIRKVTTDDLALSYDDVYKYSVKPK